MSSSELAPGSILRFAMRSIGARFHAQAREFATPLRSKPALPARAAEITPPKGRFNTPFSIRKAFSAGAPSSSKAKLANCSDIDGSNVTFNSPEPY